MIDLNSNDLTGKRIVIDLDHTLCIPNDSKTDTYGKYGNAEPKRDVIDKVRIWKSRGACIIIHTARRMGTHKGNLENVLKDVSQLTKNWLAQNNVPYDELIFGKPNGDVYIDDKALNVEDL